jgi:hypothetical protein
MPTSSAPPHPVPASSAAFLRSISGMRTTQEIVASIDSRLRELSAEIKTLDAARAALEHRERQSSRAPARPAATKRRASAAATSSPARASRKPSRTSRRPASNGIPADQLESLLSGNGGLTTSALAEQTNADRDQVLALLRELETAGRVRRSGQRRGTRWHAITDEDRIRARAAELEATRKHRA